MIKVIVRTVTLMLMLSLVCSFCYASNIQTDKPSASHKMLTDKAPPGVSSTTNDNLDLQNSIEQYLIPAPDRIRVMDTVMITVGISNDQAVSRRFDLISFGSRRYVMRRHATQARWRTARMDVRCRTGTLNRI